MVTAYFDESGHPRDREVVTIGAVVSSEKKWRVFEEKWEKRLRREKVTVPFHMSEWESPHSMFAKWDKNRRLSLIVDLSAIATNSISFGVAHSLVVRDWEAVMDQRWEIEFERKRATYVLLLQTCLEQIAGRIKLPNGEQLACVFEENDFIEEAVSQQFLQLKRRDDFKNVLGTMTFAPKNEFVQLQAADMIAFEGYKHVLNQIVDGGIRPERKLHASLKSSGRITEGFMDFASFSGFLNHIAENEAQT